MNRETKRTLQPSRRKFNQAAAVATGAAVFSAPNILRGQGLNDKLNIAVIGAGGRGGANLGGVRAENIVALCDVNQKNLNAAAARHPKAKTFVDFRKLFDQLKNYDAVVVSTCEHTHAFATLPALQLGKHVYCEKPLTYNIEEARKIRLAAEKAHVATQMGTQIHAGENYRRVVELIQGGVIGKVRECHVWVGRAWGWQSADKARQHRDIVSVMDRPKQTQAIPSYLNWDLWLGPAPKRPYHNVYFPGPKWYRWWDFGNGTMSDLGSHWIDLPFWALNLDKPKTIEASGPKPHAEIAPASMKVTYEYGARKEMPPVQVNWYQGTEKPEVWKNNSIPKWGSGVLFVGDKGMVLSDYGKHTLLPTKDSDGFKKPPKSIPKSLGHHAEWVHACNGPATDTHSLARASCL